jgi:HAD superfamily hydrolase (TIGR01662 family)
LISAILFDYGGTLVRRYRSFEGAKPDALRAAYALLNRNGLTLTYEEYVERNKAVFRKYSALEKKENRDISDLIKYQELIGGLFPTRSEAWRKRVARGANDAFWNVIIRNCPIRKNTRRTLSKLKSMDIQLAIVSNHHNHEALVRHVRELGIASNFTRIFSSVKSGVRKPDPRIFESCLSSLKVGNPGEAVFVGDSLENDVEGAQSAGMRTILIVDDGAVVPDHRGRGRSRAKPDFTIRDLAEIPGIVSSL